VYPQAVYFPIRTLYLTLKIEQRERYKSGRSWLGLAGWVSKGSFHVCYVDTPLPTAPLLHMLRLQDKA
jgi:hypothetical protein